ncbi:hypothetical protein HYV56_01840 [Candidatus Peregrinibacteria bacterium]|nr:hypothetical protein [Candidatus Peregrinibacteria bacterium]
MKRTFFIVFGIGLASLLFLVSCNFSRPSTETNEVSNPIEIVREEEPVSKVPTPKTPQELTVISDESEMSFVIFLDGKKVSTIPRDNPSQMTFQRVMKKYAYIGFNYTGLGGYILYSGPDEVWRLDLSTYTLDKVLTHEMQSLSDSDISPDEKMLAYIRFDVSENQVLVIRNIESAEEQEYAISSQYPWLGDVYFSPDGSKVALAAAEKEPVEKGGVFIVEVPRGAVSEVVIREDGVYYVKGWNNNDEVGYVGVP